MGIHLSVVMPVYNERYLVAESIARVLAVESPRISRLDLIVVDDGSTDGTRDILRAVAARHPDRITYVEHPENRGKGGAVATGIALARGEVTVIQDADLEYNPRDLPRLMVPFENDEADAVYGSRFLSGDYRRVLYYRHSIGNKVLTTVCNVLTDLNLSDMETCYKAVRTPLLQSIPIRSRDFRVEPELTFKLKKRGARMYEVPISYAGRTYEEGKKIGVLDGLRALGAMFHWWLIDDIYKPDEYGSNILVSLADVPKFNRWMADALRPHLGASVLELGAGIGNMTRTLCPRDRYTASDINPHYLDYLRRTFQTRPYLDVAKVDAADPRDFAALAGKYDTIVCLNVLEHVKSESTALANMRGALVPGGRAVVLVPQGPGAFGTLDEVLGHERRYTRESLAEAFRANGFELETMFDFNRTTLPAWWFNGRILRRRHFGKLQLKLLNMSVWLVRRLDGWLPWPGTSLIAIARRPVKP
ncbi:MAG TPA: glycosyltransferase [Planctomycetota bacterium]|jgi:glycosyltransferase involved in cell wall biosynthesis|nr:glycosyltransferase [Planctomycetota bacterium]